MSLETIGALSGLLSALAGVISAFALLFKAVRNRPHDDDDDDIEELEQRAERARKDLDRARKKNRGRHAAHFIAWLRGREVTS